VKLIELAKERAAREAQVDARVKAEDEQLGRDFEETERLILEHGMSWAEANLIVTGIDATKYGPLFSDDPPWAVELREKWRQQQQERRRRLRLVR
jgi:hypothetical protein